MISVDRIQGLSGSLGIKAPVTVATTENITLSGLQTIDDVVLASGDRVLVKDQTVTTDNGIWVVSSGTWSRSPDFDGVNDAVNGTVVVVADGTVSAGHIYMLSATDPVTPGSAAMSFSRWLDGAQPLHANLTGLAELTFSPAVNLSDMPSAKNYGAVADGVADDTTALNAGIAAINAGIVKQLHLPGGYLISAALTAITADDWAIYGDGMGATRITMSSGAGTVGTVFTVGSGADSANRWSISDLELKFDNSASLNGTGNPFDIIYSADGLLERVRAQSGNGFVTLGSTALTTTASRQAISYCRTNAYSPAGGNSVDIQSQAGLVMHGCSFAATGTAAGAFRGMLVHPAITDTMDNMKVSSCEWNYPGLGVVYGIEFDLTNNTASTQTFNNCVFDQAYTANIYAHIDSGAIADARFSASFVGCTSNGGATGTVCALLDNTGGKEMSFRWTAGHFSTPNTANAIKLTGGNRIDARVDTTVFISRASTTGGIPIVVDTGCSGLSVQGCSTTTSVSTATGLPFVDHTYFVEFVSTASSCTLTGNNAATCSADLIKWTAIGTSNLETIIIKNNTAAKNKFPFTVTTSDATPTTVYAFALSDEKSYIIHAKVHAQNAAGSNRAYYEYKGLYYRDAGGGATLQGSVVTIAAIESDAAWGCALAVSSNSVNLNVTGAAGIGIEWMFDVEVTENDK